MRRERAYRGISLRLALRYLRNLGGEEVDVASARAAVEGTPSGPAPDPSAEPDDGDADADGDVGWDAAVADEGWRALLATERVEIGPSLGLTEVTVLFDGDPEALEPLIERFSQKAMRAGG